RRGGCPAQAGVRGAEKRVAGTLPELVAAALIVGKKPLVRLVDVAGGARGAGRNLRRAADHRAHADEQILGQGQPRARLRDVRRGLAGGADDLALGARREPLLADIVARLGDAAGVGSERDLLGEYVPGLLREPFGTVGETHLLTSLAIVRTAAADVP